LELPGAGGAVDSPASRWLGGRKVALGRLGSAEHPSGESGRGGSHRKNVLHGDVTRWRGAHGGRPEEWWREAMVRSVSTAV
jgi:hypothetical protein